MYDVNSVLIQLIEADNWGSYSGLIAELKQSNYWDIFYEALLRLDRSALYLSPVHGVGHIERTLLHGAFCAMDEQLDNIDTRLLMDMCSYHDTGRISDWLDTAHGLRSSLKLEKLTGRSGEELKIMKAGVEAHSLNDKLIDDIILKHAPENRLRARRLAELLKDADGLDRVRINDLNIKFLRRQSSRSRAPFAQYLFDRYAEITGISAGAEADEGFDLGTILGVKSSVTQFLDEGRSCAQTALLCLGNLNGVIIKTQLLDAASGLKGSRCGLLDAALLFFGVYFIAKGYGNDEISALCTEYTELFGKQYGTDSCLSLSPAGGSAHSCDSLAVDAILFAHSFIKEKTKKYK
jgi:hypothetical protein